ncbi:MAG: hypothetical protein ACYS99_20270 [Planctomycetota bacterium]|jgi:hypothetical protein
MGNIPKRSLRVLGLLVLAVLFLGGCKIRQADLTVVATGNVNLDRVDLDSLPGQDVEGESVGWVVLFFPVSFPHLEDAVDDALRKGRGDLMTDAVMYTSGWWFLVGQNIITVKGRAVKTRGSGGGR